MRVSGCQVQSNVVAIVHLEKYGINLNQVINVCSGAQGGYPAHGFQGNGVNLVYVVDLRGGVVVLAIAYDVDQVVVGKVGDGVAEICECSDDKHLHR